MTEFGIVVRRRHPSPSPSPSFLFTIFILFGLRDRIHRRACKENGYVSSPSVTLFAIRCESVKLLPIRCWP